jgi:hypothetical protein
VGALVIADGAVGRLGWVAAGFSLAALLASSKVLRRSNRKESVRL